MRLKCAQCERTCDDEWCRMPRRDLVRWAKDAGWRRINGHWFCAKCVRLASRATLVPEVARTTAGSEAGDEGGSEGE